MPLFCWTEVRVFLLLAILEFCNPLLRNLYCNDAQVTCNTEYECLRHSSLEGDTLRVRDEHNAAEAIENRSGLWQIVDQHYGPRTISAGVHDARKVSCIARTRL